MQGCDPRDKTAAILAQNNRGLRRRGKTSGTGLLTGILFDMAGNRYTPTHAVKNGKRYRYYTSQAAIQRRGSPTTLRRLPAHDIESLVLARITALLTSPVEFTSIFRESGAPESMLSSGLVGAKTLATKSTAAEFVEVCRTFLKRAVSVESRVSLEISPASLLAAVFAGLSSSATQPVGSTRISTKHIKIDCEFQLRHWSNELRLVIPCAAAPRSGDATPLVKALARARRWYEQVISGEVQSFEQIANEIGTTSTYVSRIFKLASFSPVVVESILAGSPLCRPLLRIPSDIPLDWTKQAAHLSGGIGADAPSGKLLGD